MILTDAGPLIAIIDRADAAHAACVAALSRLRGPMLTTWPALTEAVYLLGARAGWRGQEAVLRLVQRGDLVIAELKPTNIERCGKLMEKYAALPMDLADASLLVVAERMRLKRIFTLDSDFKVYRMPDRRALEMIPSMPARTRSRRQ